MIQGTDFVATIRALIRREEPDDGDRVGLRNVALLNHRMQLSRIEDFTEFLCTVHLVEPEDGWSTTFIGILRRWFLWLELDGTGSESCIIWVGVFSVVETSCLLIRYKTPSNEKSFMRLQTSL